MKYYAKKYPNINDTVFVTINNFSDRGTYCNLLEYDNIEGFILNTELDRKVKIGKKQFKYGKIYPVLVLNVSPSFAIDLSYKKIKIDEREELVNKFYTIQKIKLLTDEFVFLFKSSELTEELIYNLTIWNFFDEEYLTNPSELLNNFLKNPKLFVANLIEDYPEQSNKFVDDVKSRLVYTDLSVSQKFKLIIYEDDAITKLRNVLTYNEDPKTVINYISSPIYQILTTGDTELECDNNINKYIDYLKLSIINIKCFYELLEKETVRQQFVSIKPLNQQ